MNQKLPFYMVYQMPLQEDEEAMLKRDYDYMRSAYPNTAKRLLPFVEEECDRMEYEGSMVYDEYPDLLQLRLMCKRIFHKAKTELKKELSDDQHKSKKETKNENNSEDMDLCLMELIQILLFQELCRRRSERRCIRRRLYQI